MTAFQPDPDKETAYDALGGLRPTMTDERRKALGDVGLAIESPRDAARAAASRYYTEEFGLNDARDMEDDVRAGMRAAIDGLREKTLEGMENYPGRVVEPKETPEEAGARILREAAEDWDRREQVHIDGRLF